GHVERVVMRLEWPGGGATRNRMHHRRLDLGEIVRVEERAQEADQPAADLEDAPRLRVDDQIDVTLPDLQLRIDDAVPLLRQRAERLHEQPELGRIDRQLARVRLEELAARGEDVADVPLLEVGVERLAQPLALHENLDLPRAVLELHEARLAHHALREHAARHADLDALALEDLGRVRTVRGDELAAERVAAKVVRKSLAALAQPRELRAPLPDQPILVLLP